MGNENNVCVRHLFASHFLVVVFWNRLFLLLSTNWKAYTMSRMWCDLSCCSTDRSAILFKISSGRWPIFLHLKHIFENEWPKLARKLINYLSLKSRTNIDCFIKFGIVQKKSFRTWGAFLDKSLSYSVEIRDIRLLCGVCRCTHRHARTHTHTFSWPINCKREEFLRP